MDTTTSTARICALNDAARRHPIGACRVFFTRGIDSLPADDKALIWDRVAAFDDFTPDNDPWGEHDFGSFDHRGKTIMWKFDYYDLFLCNASRDPADPVATRRVLTVMFAEEY